MSASCETVSLEFGCSPEKVWSVFTDANRYGEWYGYPRALELVEVEPSFTAGGKLSFGGMRGTSVITAFVPYTNFAISSSAETNVFTVTASESGCRVSLTTSLNSDDGWRGTAAARSRANREILHRLRRAAGIESEPAKEALPDIPEAQRPGSLLSSFFSGILHGYKNPLARRKGGAQDSIDLAQIIDNTEADVVIHRNAALSALALCALMFAVISVSVRFPLADVVPSSGLSVYNSDKVNKTSAEALVIGQTKESVELALSCAGTRLDANKFVYFSEEGRADGERIYIVYDAYGEVRRFAYIDGERAQKKLSPEIKDLTAALGSVCAVADAERACGYELSSFWTDKSGVSVLRFGLLDSARDVFDALPSGELEITVDANNKTARASYYAACDTNDPLPDAVVGKKLTRQYNNTDYYIADRLAYGKLFLTPGLNRSQTDALLETEGVEYMRGYNGATIYTYSMRSAAADEAQYRYRIDVTFSRDDAATRAVFRNRSLALREDVLFDEDEYRLERGMTLDALTRELGILPTYAALDGDALTLGYGAALNEYEARELRCELTARLDAKTLTLTDYYFNSRG